MAQNEQTTEEHSTLEQQSPGRLDHHVKRTTAVIKVSKSRMYDKVPEGSTLIFYIDLSAILKT